MGGVDFVDDSKATNAHATASALDGFEHVVLLAGGRDRSRNLDALRPYAPHLRAVVAIGEAAADGRGGRSATWCRSCAPGRCTTRCAQQPHGREPGDTVLLSPACASFDWYASYAERGDDFAREVATPPTSSGTCRDGRHGDRVTNTSAGTSGSVRRRAARRRHRSRSSTPMLIAAHRRGAEHRRRRDGALGVVGGVAHRLRLAVVLLPPAAAVDAARARRVRRRHPARLPHARARFVRPLLDRERGAARGRADPRGRRSRVGLAPLDRRRRSCVSSRASWPSSRSSSTQPTSRAGAPASSATGGVWSGRWPSCSAGSASS